MERIIIWAAVLAISLIVEGFTAALVSIWFVPSAAVCLLLEIAGVKNLYIQIVVFAVVSAVFLLLMRKKIKASFSKGTSKTNVDALIDKTGVVETDIPEGGVGRILVNGMSWAAFTEENRSVLAGEKVKVLEVIGVKLRCIPVEQEALAPTSDIVGKQARVERRIDNFYASGTVVCDGKAYLAKSSDNEIINENEIVAITAVEDGKVVCERISAGVPANK